VRYWQRAQRLNPESWSYHIHEWSFTPDKAGKNWLEQFQKQDKPYHPKLDILNPAQTQEE
jgi:GH25 family lysozyme M1 (1,4-beta-N-acetylmuramidase)